VLIENYIHITFSITETLKLNKVRAEYNRFHGDQQEDETKFSDPGCPQNVVYVSNCHVFVFVIHN
jgi:hypothetical protein